MSAECGFDPDQSLSWSDADYFPSQRIVVTWDAKNCRKCVALL
jgi:hypothetical protein